MPTTAPVISMDAVQELLEQLVRDIEALPRGALPLVGALVSLEHRLPGSLRDWLLDELIQRADEAEVTPAAEAMMRLRAFSERQCARRFGIGMEAIYWRVSATEASFARKVRAGDVAGKVPGSVPTREVGGGCARGQPAPVPRAF